MSDTRPPVVSRYLCATDVGDFPALAACFTPEGTVLDEGHTYRGRAQIIEWRETVAAKWTYTSTITGSEPLTADEYRVNVRVEGDFPGGVADLTYRFAMQDGLIAHLSIVG